MVCVLAWGTTWYAITFQLGDVPISWSVCYRFLLAALVLGGICKITKRWFKLSWRQHSCLCFQGLCICCVPYWLIYESEKLISSGLTAVLTTTILYFNVLIRWLWLRAPLRVSVIAGGVVGTAGVLMIFVPEILGRDNQSFLGIVMVLSGSFFISVGGVASEKNKPMGIDAWQGSSLMMLYGALIIGSFALLTDEPVAFDVSFSYVASLLYLVLVGSLIAMTCYLMLIRSAGADRAGYVDVAYPVVALGVSTLFEGYCWDCQSVIGVIAILVGNMIALCSIDYSAWVDKWVLRRKTPSKHH